MKSVLFVCLGNICRSPAAEALFRERCPHIRTDSAGTSDFHVGEPPYAPMASAAGARGIDMKRIARPDIYIDDAMPQLPAKIHLDPRSEEFEGFVATAQLDLKAALVELFDQNGVFSTLDADGNDEAPGSDLA